ncbi:hypothetical protein RYX36_018300 [Vicia faba]
MSVTRNWIGKFNGKKEGDSLACYLVRIGEMVESIKIIQQALEGIPGGPYENFEIRCFDREKEPEWNDFEYRFIGKKSSPTFELPKQELYISLWEKLIVEMRIDTTEVQDINSFSELESFKEVYGILWILVPILILILGITISVLAIVWLEREISAGVQQRIGPEYAGPFGILQALADITKLLFKENLIPSRGDIHLFSIGPSISIISILISYLVIPFGYNFVLSDFKIGVFLWIAISSIAPIGLLMSGYGSNNKYSFLGGLRAAAQSISYEIPLTLCVLSISLRLSNSLSIVDIVDAQAKYGFWGWNLWRQPMGFIVFLISSLAEYERLPFDLPEAEEELVAGYQT